MNRRPRNGGTGPWPPEAQTGRLAPIDVVRGFAILWVLAYHLWTDLRFPNVYPDQDEAFREVPQQLAAADVPGAIAATIEALLRVGYLGVPLFMMLSGVSLTFTALRRESTPSRQWRALPRRMRRLMTPYWAGFAITVAFAGGLAFVQWQRHGGAPYIDYLRNGDINLHADQLVAGLLLFPRMVKNEWLFAPEGSLWFVVVVVQYYLLFPVLLAALRRVGPAAIVLGTLFVTCASTTIMIAVTGNLLEHRSWVETGSPFRIVEFGAGIAIGFMVARGPSRLRSVSRPGGALAAFAIGVPLFVAGCFVPLDAGYATVFEWPLIIAGLAFIFTPVIAMRGGFVVALPGRALAWAGVMSYALLIVNEPMRSITHTMRAERAPTEWVAAWVLLGFIPLTFLLARPLARWLGLVERAQPLTRMEDLVPPQTATPSVVAEASASSGAPRA